MGVKNILLKNFAKKNVAKKIIWKKFFFQSEHVSSQIWCQKFFPLVEGGGPPGKIAQNELKQILVLEFLRSEDLRGGGVCEIQTTNQPTRQTHAIVTR